MEGLKELAKEEGATLYMVLLAAFKELFSRYTGLDDIAIGTSIAGRKRQEIEGLVGFFVNFLVIRTDLGGNPTFRELLGRVKREVLGAYDHQDLPFEKMMEEVGVERVPNRTPLFQILMVHQNAPMDKRINLNELKLTNYASEGKKTSNFDMTLFTWEAGGKLHGSIEYSTELFEAETIERMVQHYKDLLGVIL